MKKKADPLETIFDAIDVVVESGFEDTEVTMEEVLLAKKRFKSALQYIIVTTMEEYQNEKVTIQSNTSA